MNKKLLIVSGLVLPLIGLGATATAMHSSGGNNGDSFVNELSKRFNLNENEVKDFMGQHQKDNQHQGLLEKLRSQGLSEGQISDFQTKKQDMRDAMKSWREQYPDATKDEVINKHRELRQEFATWAQENGVELGHGQVGGKPDERKKPMRLHMER